MKWTYWPPRPESAEMWQLNDDHETPVRGCGKLYLINCRSTDWGRSYGRSEGWHIIAQRQVYGTIPLDTPPEELHALAIAMFRLGKPKEE